MELINWWFWIIMFLTFFIIELIVGFFFNNKIHKIAERKHFQAAIYGGIASFLLTMMGASLAIILFSNAKTDGSTITNIPELLAFGFLEATAVMLGNATAAMLVPVYEKKMLNFQNKAKFKKKLKQLNKRRNNW